MSATDRPAQGACRSRFAPSPTGHLHIGGARTALYALLIARRGEGQFLLRIEDTDPERSRREHEAQIITDMSWLGLAWDEGPEVGGPVGPYRQSERTDTYRSHRDRLLTSGHAYRCDCSRERLDAVREAQRAAGDKSRYDGRCRARGLGPEAPDTVVRFRLPDGGETTWVDAVKGSITVAHAELDDFVLTRTDGTPTYNFACVVDDASMGITHVVRGDDHVGNTPKQILLYQAFGLDAPVFGHPPMILGPDGARLSKRHGATAVGAYRDMGLLPEALVNYLARLGWGHGDREVFDMDELTELFTLRAVSRSGARWDMTKLLWLNQTWIMRLSSAELAARARPFFDAAGVAVDDRLETVVGMFAKRARTLVELVDSARVFFEPLDEIDAKAAKKHLKASCAGWLSELVDTLAGTEWTAESVETAVLGFAAAREMKLGKVAQPVRVSLLGRGIGPGLYETLVGFDKDEALGRIRAGAARCAARAALAAGR